MMRSGITLLATALLLHGIGAQASSLDKDVCAKLKDEQAQLEQTGLRATIAKGPGWAKGNLAPDKMQQVRRLIEVDEQLLFRCQGKPLVLLPSSVDADPVASVDESADGEKDADGNVVEGKPAPRKPAPGKEVKAPAAKKAAVAKTEKPGGDAKAEASAKKAPATPKAAPKAPAAQKPPVEKQGKDGGGQSAATKVAKSKPAAKKKADDAYKPPLPDPAENPFALQDAAKK